MVMKGIPEQRLLIFYCSFTCIYLTGIITSLKLRDNFDSIGTYKFLPILSLLIFAELMKLSFSLSKAELSLLGITVPKPPLKNDNSWTKSAGNALKFISVTLVLTAIYYFIVVVFGAPLLTHHEETLMLAITLTSLTWIPASLQLGIDSAQALFTGSVPRARSLLVEAVATNVKITLLGTWIGAIFIPLDWDRPWQVWPIPCMIGTLVGYLLAHIVNLIRMIVTFKWKGKFDQ